MLFNHVGLVCRSEKDCDRFYMNLLGLQKLPSKVLPAEKSKAIFGVDQEYQLLYYANEQLKFEIFLSDQKDWGDRHIGHTCLEIRGRETFFEKCRLEGLESVKIPRESSDLLFVKDFDGNLFELKEKE
ncbi:MAG: hypothetical protein HQM13_11660 [SAR324 cluster bacterium]|nr:hypothetical protein [SAR324 cluster bacterium]